MVQDNITEQVEEQIKEVVHEDVWTVFSNFMNYEIFHIGDKEPVILTVRVVIVVLISLLITSFLLRLLSRLLTRRLPYDNKKKFVSVFSFFKYFVYLVILFITLDNIGFNITGVFAASAALLVGVGLALQTLIQDIISGIFIFLDQTVHVGDIIELEGKVGRVEEIKLRTTRAVTIDNKVLIIPNHKYLTSTLFNWTQNGAVTRESVDVGVAYGSDTELVKQLLIKAVLSNDKVLETPEPRVLFTNFGDNSLDFRVVFTINDSFQGALPKSEIRFEIDRLFRENNVTIPFPQRDVHIIQNNASFNQKES